MDRIRREHAQCLSNYLNHCKKHSMPTKSISTRGNAIKKFQKYMHNKMMADVDSIDIQGFLDNEKENDTSEATINSYFAFLKHFFAYCKDEGVNKVLEWNRIDYEAIINKSFEVFSEKEVEEFFGKIRNQKNPLIRLRDDIIFSLLFFTGCTLKELHSLVVFTSKEKEEGMVSNTDYYVLLNEGEIYFRGQYNRKMYLPLNIVEKIVNYRTGIRMKAQITNIKEGYNLFISTRGEKSGNYHALTYNQIQSRMLELKKKCSFAERKLSIKSIRHTVISRMIENDFRLDQISQIVGLDISSLKFYIKEYTKYENEIQQIMAEKHPFIGFLK